MVQRLSINSLVVMPNSLVIVATSLFIYLKGAGCGVDLACLDFYPTDRGLHPLRFNLNADTSTGALAMHIIIPTL